jgi:hypothetical protein
MTEYDDQQDQRDTAAELHQRALDRRDRQMDRAPAGTPEPNLETEALGRLAEDPSVLHLELPDTTASGVDVLPRDLDDHPGARATVDRLANLYDSVEVDRLAPMGALVWLLTCRAGNRAVAFRVTANGALLPVVPR